MDDAKPGRRRRATLISLGEANSTHAVNGAAKLSIRRWTARIRVVRGYVDLGLITPVRRGSEWVHKESQKSRRAAVEAAKKTMFLMQMTETKSHGGRWRHAAYETVDDLDPPRERHMVRPAR
ncbi:hypothetical protein [Nonomuraea sp. B19D2]|uniref:hypothetical protein n=1 Tax=Nonomuraea sp. B19D2 TaxID=3159561 RepID=UPI0032DBE123